MQRSTPRSAAVYCRISHDPSGERLGVRRQEVDCVAEARRRGWRVAQVYVDDDRSAYNTRKPRPEYQRLLSDIAAGEVDGVMVWRLDRLHRQPRELEEFIVLCDHRHVALATVTGDVDLSTTQGRLVARTWGAFAVHESEVKSERIKRALLERARRGKDQWVTRTYGYNADRQTVNKAEAAVIREAVHGILEGESLISLCRDLNRRGVPTTHGAPWSVATLRRVVTNPRIAGQAQYRGEVVGKGQWQAIIQPSESARVRDDVARRYRAPGPRDSGFLLVGLVRCAWCGRPLWSQPSATRYARRGRYGCSSHPGSGGCGRISVVAQPLEAYVYAALLERLESAQASSELKTMVRDRHWVRAQSQLQRAEQRLADLARDYASGALLRAEWQAARRTLLETARHAGAVLADDRHARSVATFVGHRELLEAAWPSMSIDRRRSIVRSVIDSVEIHPALWGQRFFNAKRVVIQWHGGPPQHLVMPRYVWRDDSGARIRKLRVPQVPVCTVKGCERRSSRRSLCSMHYQRWWAHGDTGGAAPAQTSHHSGKPCKVHACSTHADQAGLCTAHYEQWMTSVPPERACSVEGCGRPRVGRGLCHRHWTAWRRTQADSARRA